MHNLIKQICQYCDSCSTLASPLPLAIMLTLFFIHLFLGLSPPSAPHEDQHTGLISTAVSSSHDYSSTSNPIICQQVTERRPKDEEITQINQPISISQTKKLNDTNQSAELNDNKQTDDLVINNNKISDNESTDFSPGNSIKGTSTSKLLKVNQLEMGEIEVMLL